MKMADENNEQKTGNAVDLSGLGSFDFTPDWARGKPDDASRYARFEGRDDISKFPTEKAFLQALMDEFDNKRPVYCSATYNGDDKGSFDGGHAFVIDGYAYATTNTKKDKPYFHFNWGWGGTDQVGNPTLWYRLNGSTDK